MPSQEYLYESDMYENEESVNDDGFTKVQRKNKNKNYFSENDDYLYNEQFFGKNAFYIGKDNSNNDKYIFSSGGQGKYIRSATTGYKTIYKVGSLDENLFFSVIDSRAINGNKEPITFYFDSPEQFQRVMGVNLNSSEKWHKKYFNYKTSLVNKNTRKHN